jgi:hypothetical protein
MKTPSWAGIALLHTLSDHSTSQVARDVGVLAKNAEAVTPDQESCVSCMSLS